MLQEANHCRLQDQATEYTVSAIYRSPQCIGDLCASTKARRVACKHACWYLPTPDALRTPNAHTLMAALHMQVRPYVPKLH
jgi:hypothetical protein